MVHWQQRSSCCLLAETPILVHAVTPVAVPVPRWSTPPLPFGTAGGRAAAGRALLSLLSLPHTAAWLQEDEGERAASRQPARPADPWGGSELCAGKRGDQSPGGSPRCPAAVCGVSPSRVTPGPFLSLPGGWHGEQGVSFLPRALPTWLCPHIPSVKGLGAVGSRAWSRGTWRCPSLSHPGVERSCPSGVGQHPAPLGWLWEAPTPSAWAGQDSELSTRCPTCPRAVGAGAGPQEIWPRSPGWFRWGRLSADGAVARGARSSEKESACATEKLPR